MSADTVRMPAYQTDFYRCDRADRVFSLIEHCPFAIITPDDCPGGEFAFLPLLLERESAPPMVFGHIDNQNPFFKHLNGSLLHALFLGPNAYISPRDYVSEQLPTWNYAVAQISGTCALLPADQKLAYMARMVDLLEGEDGARYSPDETDPAVQALLDRISFFSIRVTATKGVFKFSQDKSADDQRSAGSRLLRKVQKVHHRFLSQIIPGLRG